MMQKYRHWIEVILTKLLLTPESVKRSHLATERYLAGK